MGSKRGGGPRNREHIHIVARFSASGAYDPVTNRVLTEHAEIACGCVSISHWAHILCFTSTWTSCVIPDTVVEAFFSRRLQESALIFVVVCFALFAHLLYRANPICVTSYSRLGASATGMHPRSSCTIRRHSLHPPAVHSETLASKSSTPCTARDHHKLDVFLDVLGCTSTDAASAQSYGRMHAHRRGHKYRYGRARSGKQVHQGGELCVFPGPGMKAKVAINHVREERRTLYALPEGSINVMGVDNGLVEDWQSILFFIVLVNCWFNNTLAHMVVCDAPLRCK